MPRFPDFRFANTQSIPKHMPNKSVHRFILIAFFFNINEILSDSMRNRPYIHISFDIFWLFPEL